MDISTVLIAFLQGEPWGASAIVVVGVIGYALTHLFPLLPKPKTPTGFYSSFYGVVSFLAGNWGNAKNAGNSVPT